MPLSLVRAYFKHPVFEAHVKNIGAERDLHIELIKRVSGVTRAVYALGQAMGKMLSSVRR